MNAEERNTIRQSKDGQNSNMKNKSKKTAKKCLIILAIIFVTFFVIGKFVVPKILFPDYEEPAVTGLHTVEMKIFTWEDESRIETFTDTGENRALTVKFWYPKEEGIYPLIVFSHGAFGVIDSNYSTCTELASNGYVVASIAHPYHAAFVEDANGKVTIGDMNFVKQVYADNGEYSEEGEKRIYDRSKEWMALRSADMNFVLDTVLEKVQEEEDFFVKVDSDKIGLFGHSMGGATSVQLGRERDDIDAVIDLEGTMLGEYVDFKDGYEVYNEEPYPIPVLDVNSEAVSKQAKELNNEHPNWEYVNYYLGRNAADYREIIFRDAGHLNFTDLPNISPILAELLGVGKVDAKECIENVNEVVLIYFDYYLKGKGSLSELQEVY